jgi:hypothetical protein
MRGPDQIHALRPKKISTSLKITMGIVLNKANDGINAPTTKEATISIMTIIISLLFWHEEHHTAKRRAQKPGLG